jgi:hypothetical protein
MKWIRINGQEELPKEKELFWFVPCNFFDKAFIGWIDKEVEEVFFVDFRYYGLKRDESQFYVAHNSWLPSQITHYKKL